MTKDITNLEQGLRMLDDSELHVVNGGFINDGGCITYPTILSWPPMAPKPFIDVFAHRGL